MNRFRESLAIACVAAGALASFGATGPQTALALADIPAQRDGWHTFNRSPAIVDSGGRHILRYEESAGGAMSWSPRVDFTDGDIDVDIRGRDVFQKSFIGIAFHITADTAFDVVYLRPFNFQSADPVRHAHAVQFASYPTQPWERLRADHPNEYEQPLPGAVDPNAWVHLRIAVHGRDVRVFVNGASDPVLHVQAVGGQTHGSVGPWVGDVSPGDFENLIVRASSSTPTHAMQETSKPAQAQSPSVVGDLRMEEFKSKVFANTRKLRVLLPDGYDLPENRSRKYPVLYLADGQNLFDPATSVFGPSEWQVDETVHRLVAEKRIPPMIVVGVDDAGRTARAHEYLPWADTSNARRDPAYDPNPQGKRYPEFLIDEVMPFINGKYRTMRDAAHTGLGGSSYGGLISTYTFAARPGVFGRALIESPTLSVFEGQMLKDLAGVRVFPQRIFLAVGTNENGTPGCNPKEPPSPQDVMVRGVQLMTKQLRSAGLDSTRLRSVIEPCATHTHAAWAARLPGALTFLFSE